jgi:hypothetical protein
MKRRGSLYEQKFFTEALFRNLEIFTPLGDYLPQDCMVMNQAGKVFKIQIKGTKDKAKDPHNLGLGRYMISTSTGTSKKCSIDCTKVDALVAYIETEDIWYVIPCLELNSNVKICIYPHNPKSRGKYEKYKDNWDYFKQTT